MFWACVITVLQWNSKLFIISKFLKHFSLNCFRCQSNFPQTMAKWCKKVTANVFQSKQFFRQFEAIKNRLDVKYYWGLCQIEGSSCRFSTTSPEMFFLYIFSQKSRFSLIREWNGMDCPFLQWRHPTISSNFWPFDQNRLWKNNLEKGWTRKLLNELYC